MKKQDYDERVKELDLKLKEQEVLRDAENTKFGQASLFSDRMEVVRRNIEVLTNLLKTCIKEDKTGKLVDVIQKKLEVFVNDLDTPPIL